MNRRWLTLAILLPLVALALFFGCNGVARHHGTDGACRPLPTPQSATAACLLCPVLSDAATTTAREPLPDIGTPQHTRRHEAFCPDSTLSLVAFTSHLRDSVLRHSSTGHSYVLSVRGYLRPACKTRLEHNASPTTHTVLLT